MSNSPGLVDFAIGLVNSVFNLPDGQVMFFEEFKLQRDCETNSARQKGLGLVEMKSGLVNASFSLPEWQAVKMSFFAPWAGQRARNQLRHKLYCPTLQVKVFARSPFGHQLFWLRETFLQIKSPAPKF